jgi:hypothetical protein
VFTPGNNVTNSRTWSTTGFLGPTPTGNTPTFTAGNTAGPATITVTWADGGVSKSQTFSFTITTTASSVGCNPASGVVAVGSAVNCSFAPGTGYVGDISWTAFRFSPSGPLLTISPTFTAGGTAGAATITATWTDATGSHAVTFNYTISASLSSVTCSPGGGTIAVGQVVPCSFTAGDAAANFAWSSSGFSPTASGLANENFTAGSAAGPASITATWTDGGVNKSQTFNYTIDASASVASCTPPSGTVIAGQTISCTFTPGNAATNRNWSSSGFTGSNTSTNAPTFSANAAAGPASITVTWRDGGVAKTMTFAYTISTTTSSAVCNPPSGTVATGSVINCSFNAGSGASAPNWTFTGSLIPNGASNQASISYTVGSTAGPATISVSWTDSSGAHTQSFAYTVSTTASSVTCSPAGGPIAVGSGVNCAFTPGTGVSAGPNWSAPNFTPTSSTDVAPSFVAGGTSGPATITVTWTDSSGSHSQAFSYTISGTASSVDCNPPSGTVQDGQVVNCAFNPGSGYVGGSLTWTAADFTGPVGPAFTPSFTAGTTAGPASITATWQDGTGFHSQSFNYTVSTTASTVVCSPSNLSTIAAGSTVTCTFNAGAGYNTDLAWSATNFTPTSSGASPQVFTAANTSGTGTIGVTWSDGAGFHSQNFTYTITATASTATCSPSGGVVAGNQVVACSFNPGSGYVAASLNWSASNFGPASSTSQGQSFTAQNVAGAGSITATWTDGSGFHSQTFSYVVNTTNSAATCTPSSGTIPANSAINCSFTASIGYVNGSLTWVLSPNLSFAGGSSSTSVSPSVIAGITAGPATITANWADSSGNRSQSFSYTIGATASDVDCSPADGAIAPSSVVNCTFTPGTGYLNDISWTATAFTPVSATTVNPAFTASATPGPASITAKWTDSAGSHTRAFGYTIASGASSVNCSPINGTSFAPGTVVNCLFTPGAAYVANSINWTSSNFTPPTSTTNGQAFTAGAAGGPASITAVWNDGAGPRSQTFAYNVVVSVLACVPGAGTILSGTVVICSFTGAPGATFTGWAASGFTPTTSPSTAQVFVAGSAVPNATITGSWTDATGAHSTVFRYTVNVAPTLAKSSLKAASALGKTQNSGVFSVSTKVPSNNPKTNNVVTIRFTLSPSMAGKHIVIYRAIRSCSSAGTGPVCASGRKYAGWSSFARYTSRVVDAQGNAYFYVSSKTAQWLSFYGVFLGDSVQGPARSQTQQVRWR